MDLKEFKKEIGRANRNFMIIGNFIMAFGFFMFWVMAKEGDPEAEDIGAGGQIVLWVLILTCIIVGLLGNYVWISSFIQMRKGTHPLVNAIERYDKGFVVWVYENITQVKGGGSNHQVMIFTNDGKSYSLTMKKKRVQPVINYLKGEFPNAVVGYTDEIAKQMKENLKHLKKSTDDNA